MTLDIRSFPSPNFNARDPAVPLQFIVLHYTGMPTTDAALARLCDKQSEVSAHYVLDEAGRVFQLVDETCRAWHAGKSFWRGITDINSASIGIELANPGHEFGYRPYPSVQIAALKELMHDIVRRHALNTATSPLAHSDIAPSRKQDPGELFPWKELAKDGLGIWPEPTAADYGTLGADEVQELLKAIGYDADSDERAALLAFQRRYYPENMTGSPHEETVARLRALKRLSDSTPAMLPLA